MITTTGERPPQLAGLDWLLRGFMAEQQAAGCAVALIKGRRLVFARGYGWADRALDIGVEPTSRFRIASVSKPLTAVGILQLVERGRLDLNARVFDLLTVDAPADSAPDPRLAEVTVRHCLHHAGGWDRDVSYDPMFESPRICAALGCDPPADRLDIIRYMRGQPLDFTPGERYAYSNFGYNLLGRVIEAIAGVDYETYIRDQVLAPAGIRRMQCGRTLRALRATGEVVYTSSVAGTTEAIVPGAGATCLRPYGAWYLEAMDSHGAWIASAVDLARFLAALIEPGDGPLLGGDARATMFARPDGRLGWTPDGAPLDSYYALGWRVRPAGDGFFAGHNGALDGTATGIGLRPDGVGWVVLFNQRETPRGEHLVSAFEPHLQRQLDGQVAWPEDDLFEAYG